MSGMSTKRPGEPMEIEEVFVALGRTSDGDEGVVASITRMGALPLVFTSEEKISMFAQVAREAAKTSGEEVRIVRFLRSGTVRVIKP